MLKKLIKCFIVLSLLLLSIQKVEAKKVSGFIINENSDTIFGKIKLSKFDIRTGALLFNGINLEQMHYGIWFRAIDSRKFKNYKATDISGFGFDYKSQHYIYHSFIIESNTKVIKDKKQSKFLQLIYGGSINLYRILERITNGINGVDASSDWNRDQSFIYYDYFLYEKTIGLTKVEISDSIRTINQLLIKYDFDSEYIKNLKSETNLKDIKSVLIDYDLWLKHKKKSTPVRSVASEN